MTQMQRAALAYSKPRSRADSGEAAEEGFTYLLSASNILAAGRKLMWGVPRFERGKQHVLISERGHSRSATAKQLEQAGGAQRHRHSPSRYTVTVPQAGWPGRASQGGGSSKKHPSHLFCEWLVFAEFESKKSLKPPE